MKRPPRDQSGAGPRDQQRAGNGCNREHQQRNTDQEADLRLGHVEVVVDQPDHRRHGEQRQAHGGAGQPQQDKRGAGSARRGRRMEAAA
jgi:hypothetical protein